MQSKAPDLLRHLRTRAGWSRDKLAKAIGMARGNSLARYEDPRYWTENRFPSEFVAKIAYALTRQGSPPIEASEIWALSEDATSIVVTSATILVPVAKWPIGVDPGGLMPAHDVVSSIQVEGVPEGENLAFVVADDHAAPFVTQGARVLVRLDDTIPIAGAVYMIAMESGVEMRRFRSNPERWQSLATPPRETFYPTRQVHIIGRVWRSITDF